MGADLILAHIWTTKSNSELDWDAGLRSIETLKYDDVAEPSNFEDYPDDDPDDAVFMEKYIRPQMLVDWAEFKEMWTDSHYLPRDADLCTLGPVRVLITGGMSWGDSPTNTFDLLSRIDPVPLKAAGFLS
jgi:hypothetical protein